MIATQILSGGTYGEGATISISGANTKNTTTPGWTADFDWAGFTVSIHASTGIGLYDILVDGEPVVLNMPYNPAANTTEVAAYFPIHVPAGAAITVASQTTVSGRTFKMAIAAHGYAPGQERSFAGAECFTANAATSLGAAATAVLDGSTMTEIVSATTRAYRALGFQAMEASVATSTSLSVGLFMGGSGAEFELARSVSTGSTLNPRNRFIPKFVPGGAPAGSRFACRGNSSNTADTVYPGIIGFH